MRIRTVTASNDKTGATNSSAEILAMGQSMVRNRSTTSAARRESMGGQCCVG
jgi:hypothetical protein